ncbi:MAG: hypothetical protein JWN90_438 [Parcubacteria group bacterium]|nr:hypothetical protein [Parcubacteria group bacterium]
MSAYSISDQVPYMLLHRSLVIYFKDTSRYSVILLIPSPNDNEIETNHETNDE